jgi:methylglutaconyl-CoA hydratase
MSEPVLLQNDHGRHVTTLTLNRPGSRNALSIELIESLTAAVREASAQQGRRVIIIRGEGPAFCAGLDLREAQDPGNSHRSATALADLYRSIVISPLVTIASVHGGAFGGGAGLVAACDLAIAAEDLKLGYPEVRRGLVAALVTCLIRRQVTGRRLREVLLLGQTLSAADALEAGLVNFICANTRLEEETHALADSVQEGAPGAIQRTKRLINDLDGIEKELQIGLDIHLKARNAEEAAEGIAAFLEKRPPRWME